MEYHGEGAAKFFPTLQQNRGAAVVSVFRPSRLAEEREVEEILFLKIGQLAQERVNGLDHRNLIRRHL